MMRAPNETREDRKIKRPVVSDLDGTQQGGLAFCVSFLGGIFLAASVAPGSLTSFWVCLSLVSASVGIAAATQKLFARVSEETKE
ncbi:MAG: hypothetical protein AAGI36_15980 [Pseudomonadota bacterium]